MMKGSCRRGRENLYLAAPVVMIAQRTDEAPVFRREAAYWRPEAGVNMAQRVAVEGSSNQVVAAVWSALLRRGYHLERSFDLQAAIAQHAEGCGCSYHGTSPCTCQYVVLLAYPPDRIPGPPRVFTVHTYEQMTWVALQPDGSIGAGETNVLLSALAEAGVRPDAEQWAIGGCTGLAVPVANK